MAVEIRLRRKYLEHANGHHKASSGTSGPNKHRGLAGAAKAEATAQTMQGAKTLILVGGRHRVFVPGRLILPWHREVRRNREVWRR